MAHYECRFTILCCSCKLFIKKVYLLLSYVSLFKNSFLCTDSDKGITVYVIRIIAFTFSIYFKILIYLIHNNLLISLILQTHVVVTHCKKNVRKSSLLIGNAEKSFILFFLSVFRNITCHKKSIKLFLRVAYILKKVCKIFFRAFIIYKMCIRYSCKRKLYVFTILKLNRLIL